MAGGNEQDLEEAWRMINTPIGEAWSGRTRYAAAMTFHQAGQMSAEALEIYRITSRLDGEDPLGVLKRWKLGVEWLERFSPEPSDDI